MAGSYGETMFMFGFLRNYQCRRTSLVAQRYRIHLQCRSRRRHGFDPWVGKIPWRRAWQPSPVFLPGESRGQRSLAGYNP